MRLLKTIGLGSISAIGGAFMVLGELDDAPGLGGIGMIMIGLSIYFNYKARK
jgi:hypothetical protein